MVSAITYLKHPEDAERLRQKFHEAGYEGFPNVLVDGAGVPARTPLRNGGARGPAEKYASST